MKKILMLLIIIANALSQKVEAQQVSSINGSWSVNVERTFNAMDSFQKSKYNSMPQQKKSEVQQIFATRTFHFFNDSLVQVKFIVRGGQKQFNGTYSFNSNNHTLFIHSDGGNSSYTVEWLNDKEIKLVFSVLSPQGLLNSLYLNRNN